MGRPIGVCVFLVLVVWIAGMPSSGQSQLLYREREGYRNYGEEGYRPYGRSFFVRLTQPVFDELGGFVMDGIEVFRLEEYETRAPVPGSVIDKDSIYPGYLRRLIVSADSYKGRSWSLIVGDRIRTKFSALTLDMAALNGVRLDLDLPTQKWSFVGSRMDRPIYTNKDNLQHLMPEHAPMFSAYLLGGHWETKIGILKLGASYANQFRVNSLVSPERNSLSGVIPNRVQAVEYLVVKVADGSPRDRSGPRVYDMRLYLNGEPSDIRPQITRHNERIVDYTYPNGDRFYPSDRPIPPFVQFIRGDFPILGFSERGFLEISGYEYLLFWFPIPAGEEIRSATFEAWVADDYVIQVAEVFVQNEGVSRNLPANRNRASFFYEVAYAKGNVKDRSNVRRVRFRYGRQTANTVGGVYARAEAKGFRFRAEFARSFDFRQFPHPKAHKYVTKANAYFVTLSRDLGPLRIGSEVFNISPGYSTTFAVQDPTYSSFSDIPLAPLAGYINAPTGTLDEAQNNTLFFNTVDDNDDKDPYPDEHFLSFIRDRNGVFPGLDEDYDRRPDLNRNSNLIPDYMEPFLLYEVNPEPYEYGDDMNNNGVIDVRENDRKPDYPYDRDLKGYHVYADVVPEGEFRLRVGRVRTEQEAAGGISQAWYLKAMVTCRRPKGGEIRWIHFVKRVRDTIPDDVFRFPLDVRIPVERFEDRVASLGLVQQFVEDPLRMSDSLVNTSVLSLRAFPFEGWTVGGSLKVFVNMRERSRPDRRSTLTDWAMVGKTSYRRTVGKLVLEPQFKVLFEDQRDSRGRTFPLRELYVYPILRLEHPLGGSTRLKVGAQGFPFFKSLYRDFAREGRDYDSQDYIMMLTNRTNYLGYDVALNLGYHIRKQRYANPERSFEGEDFTLFFARAVVSTGQRTRRE